MNLKQQKRERRGVTVIKVLCQRFHISIPVATIFKVTFQTFTVAGGASDHCEDAAPPSGCLGVSAAKKHLKKKRFKAEVPEVSQFAKREEKCGNYTQRKDT